MGNVVVVPNLPKRAGRVILGNRYLSLLEKPFNQLGLNILSMPDNPKVDQRLSAHADLSIFHAGGKRIFLAPFLAESEFANLIQKSGLNPSFLQISQGEKYPKDAQMNLCVIGNHVVYSPGKSESSLLYSQTEQGRMSIACRQAYAKCSICVVDKTSLITADSGIARACRCADLDVLEIEPGGIELKGFAYGFIGGASFKLSRCELAFTGRLDHHPDYMRILHFLESKSVRPVFLTQQPAFDVGSILPVQEG